MKTIQHIRTWLAYNYQVKLFSLISALFLWFYVVTDNSYEYAVEVPLRVRNQPEGRILVQSLPESVRVLFRGTGKAFLGLGFRNKRLELDISKAEDATLYSLTLDMIRGIPRAEDCQPVQIVGPDTVWVHLDQALEKKVPVIPRLLIDLADGYTQVGSIALDPDSIRVSGPKSIVQQLVSVTTDRRVFENISRRVRGKIGVTPPESDRVVYSAETIHFEIDIQRMHEIEMREIPVEAVNVPPGLNVLVVPPTLSLKLRGGVDLLMRIRKEEILATIDFGSRYRYPDDRIPASINVPRDVTFSDVHPKFFECIVERR